MMPVRLLFGWAFAVASLAVGIYAAVRQERASMWSWGACLPARRRFVRAEAGRQKAAGLNP